MKLHFEILQVYWNYTVKCPMFALNNIEFKVRRPSGPNYWKKINGYPMYSLRHIVQNVKLIELLGKNLVPLHFVIVKS